MWCEHNYPSFISAPSQPSQGPFIDLNDRRSTVIALDQKRDKELLELQKLARVPGGEVGDIVRQGMKTATKETFGSDLVYGRFHGRHVGVGIGSFVVRDPKVGS